MRAITPYKAPQHEIIEAEYRVISDERNGGIAGKQLMRMALVLLVMVALGTVAWLAGVNEWLLFASFLAALIVVELIVFGADHGFDKADYPGQW